MTVIAAMQPRRRAATYGKASRKPISGLSQVAADAFAQISLPDDFSDSTTKYSSLRGSKRSSHHLKSKAAAATPESEATPESPDRILYSPGQTLASTSQKPRVASNQPGTLYDVPSSDDGLDLESCEHENKGRKRRKITPKLGSRNVLWPEARILRKKSSERLCLDSGFVEESHNETHTVRDWRTGRLRHGGMAQHVVDPPSEQYRTKVKSQPPGNASTLPHDGRGKAKHKETHRSIELQKAAIEVKPSRKASVEPALPWKDPNQSLKLSSSAEIRRLASEDSKPTSPSESNNDNKMRISPTRDLYQPSTPPRYPKPGFEVTTPHQRDLWSMLLPADTTKSSPSSLNLPNLRLSDTQVQSLYPKSLYRTTSIADVVPGKTANAPRRRRIVDTLQSQEEEPAGADPMLEDGRSGAVDDDSDKDDNHDDHDSTTDESLDSQASTDNSEGRLTTLPTTSQRVFSASQPLPTLQGGSLKITYARQRSYLTESDLSEATALGAPELQYPAIERKNRRVGLRDESPSLQLAQSVNEETDEHGNSQGAALRSIHELREAGGNVRLLSEIEAILDDIEDSGASLSLRRSRLLELTQRLQEAPFRQIFTKQEFELRLFSFFGHNADPILKTLVAAATLELLVGPKSSQVLFHISNPSVVDQFVALLDVDQDVTSMAKARTLNMSRAAHLELKNYWNDLLRSNIWRAKSPASITPRVLALQCLEYIIRQAREVGRADQLLEQHAIKQIVKMLELPVSVNPATEQSTPNADLELAVSILESCTIADQTEYEQSMWAGDTLDAVVSLLPSLDARFSDVPETLRALVLRLYLNLTNNRPELCEAFSRPDVLRSISEIIISHFKIVSKEPASHALRLDSLILALGSLINLAEWCGTVPQMMVDLQHECRSFLDHFVQLFKSSLHKTAEVSEPPSDSLSSMLTGPGVFRRRDNHQCGLWLPIRAS